MANLARLELANLTRLWDDQFNPALTPGVIHSVLRGTFDQWLAELAEGAGAEYICGIPVEELVKDGSGSVVGIRAGDDAITAHVVIDCEGVNSLLAERCLGVARPRSR